MEPDPKSGIRNPQLAHPPVLLREAVDLLAPKPGGVYVDGTLGGAGHAAEVLNRSAPDGVLIGLDRDAEAIERGRKVLEPFGSRAILRQANYRELPSVLAELGCSAVNGVLLDLGVSWFHLRAPERGFSFLLEGPLDMRMDRSRPQTAADLVNGLPRTELERLIREYGEESRAGQIARAIDRARAREQIATTAQLAQMRVSSLPSPSDPSCHAHLSGAQDRGQR
jgi:16S rRNA (cytosine1402-N4)-methyltransferase